MLTPVVFPYQRALDEFRREGHEPPLLKRMSELISLLDLTTTLSSGLAGEEILDAALLTVMGELQVSRGALYVLEADGRYRRRASRSLPAGSPEVLSADAVPAEPGPAEGVVRDGLGLEIVCPVAKAGKTIALLGFGPRAGGREYAEEEVTFLRSVAACAATPIENGLMYHELRDLNQRLSVKVFQLNNLFDISRELTSSFDEEGIKNLVTTTLMGHLLVSRCALYLGVPGGGLAIAHERGLRSEMDDSLVPEAGARPILDALTAPRPVSELPAGAIRDRLQRARLVLAVPVTVGARTDGFLAVGERVGGGAFTDEDRDFALTLARQAGAALEAVRLHRVDLQKQRRDREMQIAREIQRSLFPRDRPHIDGFEVAAESLACYEVGGDHYDFIPLGDERWALAIADVSGKGAPASILMASVHASLRALAGSARPDQLMVRLNRFLFESTQENRYVTLFYAELDPARRRLAYVNAGHVPPFWLGADGWRARLGVGGPVLGLLESAQYDMAEVQLGPGELVAMVTDGATEALSPDDEEFGEDRLRALLESASGERAEGVVRRVSERVREWAGPAGCSDDLTLMVLKAV
jgi:phosphoserine phosphatase RsbU/P